MLSATWGWWGPRRCAVCVVLQGMMGRGPLGAHSHHPRRGRPVRGVSPSRTLGRACVGGGHRTTTPPATFIFFTTQLFECAMCGGQGRFEGLFFALAASVLVWRPLDV